MKSLNGYLLRETACEYDKRLPCSPSSHGLLHWLHGHSVNRHQYFRLLDQAVTISGY